MNNYFYNQTKETALGAIFVVGGSNLTSAYFKEKKFVFYTDIHNYFQLLDDAFGKWSIQFNVPYICNIMEVDLDLQLIFEELITNINFLKINLKIINIKLHFDVYCRPKNSFIYHHCKVTTHRTRKVIFHSHYLEIL